MDGLVYFRHNPHPNNIPLTPIHTYLYIPIYIQTSAYGNMRAIDAFYGRTRHIACQAPVSL